MGAPRPAGFSHPILVASARIVWPELQAGAGGSGQGRVQSSPGSGILP